MGVFSHSRFVWKQWAKLHVCMQEGPKSMFLCKKGPKVPTLFICYIAMETGKVIVCGGLKMFPNSKAHMQVCFPIVKLTCRLEHFLYKSAQNIMFFRHNSKSSRLDLGPFCIHTFNCLENF